MSAHVLILIENEGYPADARVRRHADALIDHDYEVTILAPFKDASEEASEVVGGVRVLRYALGGPARGALGYAKEYSRAALELGRLARQVHARQAVDVAIACNPPDFVVALARLLLPSRTAVLMDHHDLSPELYERKFGQRGAPYMALVAVERMAFRAAHVVMASNESYAKKTRERVAPERVVTVAHGPDPGRVFPVPPRPELKRGRPLLVTWAGSITQLDRVLTLIEAADELVNRRGRDDVAFAVLGRGDAQYAVEAEVARRGLAESVDFPGMLTGQLYREYLATADVCVAVDLPNPMNHHSTVTKVLDYMAMGRPVLQFRLDEMQRVCGDATAYASDFDSVSFADELEALLDDPERRADLGRRGHERICDGGLWPDQIPSLIAAIETARERAARPGGRRAKRLLARVRPLVRRLGERRR